MALTGNLADTRLGNLLHLLASRRVDGKLTLTQHAGTGVIVLRRGQVIYAASNLARETLGHLLVSSGLITADELRQALERQLETHHEERLGKILVDMGVVTQKVIDHFVRGQICKVIAELLEWRAGYFRFEACELPLQGEVEVDAVDLVLPGGMTADGIFRGAAAQKTERPGEQEPPGRRVDPRGAVEMPTPTVARVAEAGEAAGHLGSLKRIMVSLSSHELFGELTLEILDYAKGLMGRCILFGAGRGGFWGTGQFGVEAPPGAPPDFIRGVRLPPDPSSVLGEAMARRALWRGPLAEHAANRELVRALGGRPEEVITAPLMVGGRVLLVLFGDRLVDPMPSGEPDRFELLLLHTAIAMERNLLAQRVEHLEELRRQTQEDLPASGLYSPNPAERTRLGESSPDAVS